GDRNAVPHAPAEYRKVPLGSCQAIPSPRSPPNPGSSSWPELTAVSAVGAPPSRGTFHSWVAEPLTAVQWARITVEVHHLIGEHSAPGISDGSWRTNVPSLRTPTRRCSVLGDGSLPRLAVPSTSWVPSGASR